MNPERIAADIRQLRHRCRRNAATLAALTLWNASSAATASTPLFFASFVGFGLFFSVLAALFYRLACDADEMLRELREVVSKWR